MTDWLQYWSQRAIGSGNGANARPDYYDVVGAAEHIHKLCNLEDPSILDVGCGNGLTIFELSKFYQKLTGIDYSKSMVNWCKENLGHMASFAIGNGESIPFKDNSFDLVISMAVIQYVDNLDHAIMMVDEMYRACRPGGVVIVGDVIDKAEVESADGMMAFMPDEIANKHKFETTRSFFEQDRRFDIIIRK